MRSNTRQVQVLRALCPFHRGAFLQAREAGVGGETQTRVDWICWVPLPSPRISAGVCHVSPCLRLVEKQSTSLEVGLPASVRIAPYIAGRSAPPPSPRPTIGRSPEHFHRFPWRYYSDFDLRAVIALVQFSAKVQHTAAISPHEAHWRPLGVRLADFISIESNIFENRCPTAPGPLSSSCMLRHL